MNGNGGERREKKRKEIYDRRRKMESRVVLGKTHSWIHPIFFSFASSSFRRSFVLFRSVIRAAIDSKKRTNKYFGATRLVTRSNKDNTKLLLRTPELPCLFAAACIERERARRVHVLDSVSIAAHILLSFFSAHKRADREEEIKIELLL